MTSFVSMLGKGVCEANKYKDMKEFTKAFKEIEDMMKDEKFVEWIERAGNAPTTALRNAQISLNKLYGSVPKY